LGLVQKNLVLIFVILLTASCAKKNVKPPQQSVQNCDCAQPAKSSESPPVQLPDSAKVNGELKPTTPVNLPDYALLKPSQWESLEGFAEDDLVAAWPAWLRSCSTLINKPQWQTACAAATVLNKPNKQAIRVYLTQYFNVYSATNLDGTDTGLITGYYEPLLKGSRSKSAQYPHPLYKQPPDLITVELADIYPELKNKRVRGKVVVDKEGRNKLVPYLTRADIEANPAPLAGSELVWINDIIDVFFLQVQGSGLVKLDNGEDIHVGYADQNGQAYQSIGRVLIDRGELTADQVSMQGIKNWARNNLNKLRDLLNSNPSYVFFRELPAGLPGPLGALGVPIAVERSVAIDPKYIPLGAPIFLSTTQPNSAAPLKRLMVAQDTGGAIKGGVRADFYWGAGNEAGIKAGAMKQQGKIWVLLPKEFVLPNK
jgi:membrane-bound lytic murein transglycosylase A